jgi:hypothetical protein
MSYPKNAQEWWDQVELYREQLLNLVEEFHPYYRNSHNFTITAPAAEQVCEQARKDICQEQKENPSALFEQYRIGKNPLMISLLNQTWFGLPESSSVRCLPGFGVLCDLCSEAYVLREEEEQAWVEEDFAVEFPDGLGDEL